MSEGTVGIDPWGKGVDTVSEPGDSEAWGLRIRPLEAGQAQGFRRARLPSRDNE